MNCLVAINADKAAKHVRNTDGGHTMGEVLRYVQMNK